MKLASTRLIEHLQQQIKDERALHAAELARLLEENKRLQQQCERLTLRVGLPSTLPEPPEEPRKPVDPDAPPLFTGTTWEQVRKREIWMESDAGKRWMSKQLGTVKVLSGETVQAKGN